MKPINFPTLADLCDKIFPTLTARNMQLGVFVDLSKVFDTENHSILFTSLWDPRLGVWMGWSYFPQRSIPRVIHCSVPQCFVVDLLFLIIYVNTFVTHIDWNLFYLLPILIFFPNKDPLLLSNNEFHNHDLIFFQTGLLQINCP